MKVGVVQINVGKNKAENIAKLRGYVQQLAEEKCDLALLPEMSMFVAGSPAEMQAAAESAIDGPFISEMSQLARDCRINLHAGSLMEKRGDRFFNTSVLFDRSGQSLGRYSKIHRFDIDLPDGTVFRESAMVDAGGELVVVDIEGLRVGLSICYDIRFPELYRALVDLGADLIVVPAAFTFQTGADHWEVLLRARAIETECYVAAPAQVGSFDNGKHMNFGHAMIVDPWGTVVAQMSNREGCTATSLDRQYLNLVRARIPVRRHRMLPLRA